MNNKEISLFTKISQTNLNNDKKFNIFKIINEETPNEYINRKRRDNKDNIDIKIIRGFLNGNLIKNLNKKLNLIGSSAFFERFPQNFINDARKQSNKDILYLSLKEIFNKNELYKENEYSNYYHNLKVVENEEIKTNYLMKKILNLKLYQLYEDYINSYEFIDEINRLKQKKMDDKYIKKYLYFTKNFFEFLRIKYNLK